MILRSSPRRAHHYWKPKSPAINRWNMVWDGELLEKLEAKEGKPLSDLKNHCSRVP
ncbi:hypothetical protein ACNKHM_16865 [Shigella sonnei]